MCQTVCNIDTRGNGQIYTTCHKLAATCEDCKATHEFAAARQRIPEVPRHVG